MNKKILRQFSFPLVGFILSAVFSMIAKSILHSELLTTVFSLCMMASAGLMVVLMYRVMNRQRSDEEKLIQECSTYLEKNFGPGFKCSRALATPIGEDPRFPTGSLRGPLQIEGSLKGIPFRFRIVGVFERAMYKERERGRYIWHGSILEWGTDYQNKEYIPGRSDIEGFNIADTMNMIQSKIS